MRWPTYDQKQVTFARLDYEPFPLQDKTHRSRAEVVQIVGAEGGGKSHVTAAEITACVPWCELVYLVGQTYKNTYAEFNYLVRNLSRLGALDPDHISQPKNGQWMLTTKTGCTILTLSALNGASSIIALGQQPDIIALCEAGIIDSYSVATAAVRRATRARGRVILVGTLKDDFGWYASLVDDLQVEGNAWRGATFSLPAWTNLALYPGGEDDPEIVRLKELLPEDEFARTVAAVRMPSKALVFAREFSYVNHVGRYPFDETLPVELAIDPGYYPSSYSVLPLQVHGDQVWQIDEIYLNYHDHDEIIVVAKARPWWDNVSRGVIDIAGRQKNANSGRSAVEAWGAAGVYLASQTVGITEGIVRHRTMLKQGRLLHDERCKNTLLEYKLYTRPTDRDGNPTSDLPVDANNHAMKALAYYLVDRFGYVDQRAKAASGLAKNERLREGLEPGWD